MKRKAYYKNQIRIISKTRARFLSIFCIVFLGAAFFAGLRHSPLIMKESMHDYMDKHGWNDLNYIGTLGYDEDIIQKIQSVDDVKSIDYGFRFDALMKHGDKSNIGVTVYTTDDFTQVDIPEIVSGRLPQKDNECVIDQHYLKDADLKINQSIELKNDYGTKSYKVVGFVNDSRYTCNYERGTNSLGNGNNEAFVLIYTKNNENMALPDELFDMYDGKTFYNDLRIHLKNDERYYIFDDDYDDYVKPINKEIKTLLNQYYLDLHEEWVNDANKEIEKAEKKYLDGKNQYDDGLKQLNQGYKDYEQGLKAYQDGYKKYTQGLKEYKQGYQDYQNGLKQYDQGYKQYQSAYQDYQGYIKNVEDYDQALKQLDQVCGSYDNAKETLQSLKQLIQMPGLSDEEMQKYQQQIIQLETVVAGYEELQKQSQNIEKLRQMLPTIEAQLKSSKTVLDKTKKQLDDAKVKLASSKKIIDSSQKTLNQSKQELADAKKTLDENKQKLKDTNKQLADAKKKIDKAKKEVKDIEKGKSITLTKNESVSALSFLANCESIEALSILFPTLFFLVAALVSMTTMTRMVEELRTQNGVFRALGYNKRDVIMQYLIYAFLATFFACCFGIIFGTYFFPSIIYYLYRLMMFSVDAPTRIIFDYQICIQTFIISVAVILVVTYCVCAKELSEVPAQILRPKPPKLGKRILLEKINFIWKRLSFNQKVTMRNIFRYKKRFLMSVIGIAGCTGLIVVGFGLKSSIAPLADEQYTQMWKYDGVISYQYDLNDKEIQNAKKDFQQRKEIKETMGIYSKTITIDNQVATIEIPSSLKDFDHYIHLNDIDTDEELKLSNDGVYINAKLAELLDCQKGDKITIELEDEEYQVKVSGIYKLYFQHYIYMSPEYYQTITRKSVSYNSEYFILESNVNIDSLQKKCDQQKEIASVNFVSGISESFRNQMESINSVVIILIVCAGALCFIVLYNLTNINIQERKSEIATIKVLGFRPKEVYDYVFRENIILASIGSLVGLFLGTWIHGYLIRTVEVDMAMFIRTVDYSAYLYAIALTMIFTFLIDLFMRRVLRNIDMVESLKSIE